VIHGGIERGNGTPWIWQEALDLCEGTPDANETIHCFEQKIQQGEPLKQAIQTCGK
jgi:hypothetical protein